MALLLVRLGWGEAVKRGNQGGGGRCAAGKGGLPDGHENGAGLSMLPEVLSQKWSTAVEWEKTWQRRKTVVTNGYGATIGGRRPCGSQRCR